MSVSLCLHAAERTYLLVVSRAAIFNRKGEDEAGLGGHFEELAVVGLKVKVKLLVSGGC